MRAQFGGWAGDVASDNIHKVPVPGAQAALVLPAPSPDLLKLQRQTSCEGTICFLSPLETHRDHLTSQPCPKAESSALGVQGWGAQREGAETLQHCRQLSLSGFGVRPAPATSDFGRG